MILVADASALIALATCDGLPWLDALFGEVLVPEAVFREVTFADKPQAMRLNAYLQGKIRQVDMADFVYLDAYAEAGETQAMVLYKKAGLITHVKTSIDLIIASQIYMSSELINAVLAMADEH